MKRMVIILWTGSVIFGACSILRRAEHTHTVSATMAGVETQSAIRQDSLVTSSGRVVRVDRRWVAVAPQTGVVYQYGERISLEEEAHAAGGRSMQETAASEHHASVESYEQSRGESRVESKGMGGWWWLCIGGIVSMIALRLIRFWPFK